MPVCYFLPGFGGSELWSTLKVWLSYSDVVFGKYGALRLSANGVTPGEPEGAVLKVPSYKPAYPTSQFLGGYYERIIACLMRELPSHGYTVQPWGYDWRLDCRATGNKLANEIRLSVKPDEPCCIVAHSMGGLIARRAWWDLGQTNQSSLIRRIVTIGTPHQGSYATVRELYGPPGSVNDKLWTYNQILGTAIRFKGKFLYYRRWSTDDNANLFLSWPAFYQLFPLVGGSSQGTDHNRPALFDAGNYRSELHPNAAMLANTRNNWQAWLRSPASLPPAQVLVTVAGLGHDVPNGLQDADNIAHDGSLAANEDGDGTVPRSSAWVPGYAAHALAAEHGDLCTRATDGNRVISWILDDPVVPPPPIPANPIAGQSIQPAESEWPAWFNNTPAEYRFNPCEQGSCTC